MAVTAAVFDWIFILIFHVLVSHSTMELQPQSLPDARYFLPLLFIIASVQILALCPLRFATLCPEGISYMTILPSLLPIAMMFLLT